MSQHEGTKPMKFRQKPVEAMHFTTNNESDDACMNAIVQWVRGNDEVVTKNDILSAYTTWHNGTDIFIATQAGMMRAVCGDWIIKGVKGEFYPWKPDIFAATYELAVDSPKYEPEREDEAGIQTARSCPELDGWLAGNAERPGMFDRWYFNVKENNASQPTAEQREAFNAGMVAGFDIEARNREMVRYLKLIEHATAPTHNDGGAHENAYTLARQALSLNKWGDIKPIEAELVAALLAILTDPTGCRFCDSGKLRQPDIPEKGHDAGCGYALARAAIAKARGPGVGKPSDL